MSQTQSHTIPKNDQKSVVYIIPKIVIVHGIGFNTLAAIANKHGEP